MSPASVSLWFVLANVQKRFVKMASFMQIPCQSAGGGSNGL